MGSGIWAYRHDAAKAEAIRNRDTVRRKDLETDTVAGRVVTVLGIDGERRKSLGRTKLDFNFAPFSIVSVIAGAVSDDLLIAQLHADFGGNVRQVLKAADGEGAATGEQRQFRQ